MTKLNDGKAWLLAVIKAATTFTDYHAQYVARVVTQRENGTLDLVPEDTKMPAMTEIPIYPGVPGVAVKVRSGARVHVGFTNGDPRFPFATIWEAATVKELRITSEAKVIVDAPSVELGGEGGAPVARMGDVVDIMISAADFAAMALPGAPPVLNAVGIITTSATNVKVT